MFVFFFQTVQFPALPSDCLYVRHDFRHSRLLWLRQVQNEDGGWGYFPARQSWLEPTCYALLTLYQDPDSSEAFEKGWKLVRSWQQPDGSWRPNASVLQASWATALSLTLHNATSTYDHAWLRGINWMVSIKGSEGGWVERAIAAIKPKIVEYDRRFKGWPWLPSSSSWVEPTAHALVALKNAARVPATASVKALAQRIQEAETMLCDRRSTDGGWNYGNRKVLGEELPSYPETTGIALLGLQGVHRPEVHAGLDRARQYWNQTKSPLAKAWLDIALRNHGMNLPPPAPPPASATPFADVLITALEAMGSPQGGHQWLKT